MLQIPLEKNDPSATLFEADIAALTLEVSYYEDYHVRMKVRMRWNRYSLY